MIEALFIVLSVVGCALVVASMWSGWHPVRVLLSALFALVCGLVAQYALDEDPAYAVFAAWAARVGKVIVAIGVVTLVAGIAAGSAFVILRGRKGEDEGKVVREDKPLSGMSLGVPKPAGVSIVKVLYQREGDVTMKSLVDGTATTGERWLAAGVIAMYVGFALVFFGGGLMLMQNLLVLGLLPIVVMGAWLYARLRPPFDDYRAAKRKFALRKDGPDS